MYETSSSTKLVSVDPKSVGSILRSLRSSLAAAEFALEPRALRYSVFTQALVGGYVPSHGCAEWDFVWGEVD